MDARIVNFLQRHRVSVLGVMLADGNLHGATCHFAHIESPFQILLVTKSNTRKASGLNPDKPNKASLVVGFSEEEWVELQMTGTIKLVKEGSDYIAGKEVFEGKFGGLVKPDHVLLIFTPDWLRYTEFRRDPPITLEEKF